jgi:hypothetical protein
VSLHLRLLPMSASLLVHAQHLHMPVMHHAKEPSQPCAHSRVALTLVLHFCCQVGYAFKDEVALVEVAHKHNVDLPAVRVRPSFHHTACGLPDTLKPVAASLPSTCL